MLLRSAFWLGVAFIAIHPDADYAGLARETGTRAVAMGQQLVIEQVIAQSCLQFSCAVAAPLAIAATAPISTPSVGPPMQDSPTFYPAPVPRPRPDWMG